MSKTSVLVVDDEKDLVELVRYNLERAGYDVLTAVDGAAAFDVAFRRQPNLIVLDVMMPGMDGLEVCRRLRGDSRTSTVPIIMLTAKAAETDRVVGLELGADDYVIKPFSPRELVARVKAILRRSSPQAANTEVLRCGKLLVDCSRHEVRYSGERVSVTATEFRILEFMLRRPGRVLSRDEIINGALGHDVIVSDRTIDVHMTALRRKLGAGGEQIETVRGFGYRLSDEADDSNGE
jgi:two-component system phosphate regulon response regulator PhoB